MTDQLLVCEKKSNLESWPASEPTPSLQAWKSFNEYRAAASMDERRELGQFFTPPAVASFMAGLVTLPSQSALRILEPGAGTAILAAALCERLPGRVDSVHVDAYEVHPVLAELCEETLRFTADWLNDRGVCCTFEVHRCDFVIDNASYLTPSLFDSVLERYDVAIANPPYFKLLKDDPRSLAAAHIVHGQPNIYSIFMAIMAAFLKEEGTMVTITPRSFTSGDYFRRFREFLFSNVIPEAVHLFGSRKDAFNKDEVLQENVILLARRARPKGDPEVTLTFSAGVSDLNDRVSRSVPLHDVVDLSSRELSVYFPLSDVDDAVVSFVRSLPETLQGLGLSVSTGPVVAFRALELLRDKPNGESEVPLLWLQHIRKMEARWPIDRTNKLQYIVDKPESAYVLVPNRTYVVMRRFSAKEEHRRLVAAPIMKGQFPGPMIGLENHLNYIHRPKGSIRDDEAIGLAALLNSALVDRYFRISNGNTQVSAVELRQLPLPDANRLLALGQQIRKGAKDLDRIVADALNIPAGLIRELELGTHGEA